MGATTGGVLTVSLDVGQVSEVISHEEAIAVISAVARVRRGARRRVQGGRYGNVNQ